VSFIGVPRFCQGAVAKPLKKCSILAMMSKVNIYDVPASVKIVAHEMVRDEAEPFHFEYLSPI